jgi:hypothetical protein
MSGGSSNSIGKLSPVSLAGDHRVAAHALIPCCVSQSPLLAFGHSQDCYTLKGVLRDV